MEEPQLPPALEIYELVARLGPGKVVTLVLNTAIVGYLAARRMADTRSRRLSISGHQGSRVPSL